MESLLRLLIRFCGGERRVWSVVRVPSPEAEDARQLHRELKTLGRDRTRVTNRIQALLATQGLLEVELGPEFEAELETMILWDGLPLPVQTRNRLKREWVKVKDLTRQIREVEAERRVLLRTSRDPAMEKVRQLHGLRDRDQQRLAVRHGVLRLARVQEPARGGSSGRAHANAAPER